MLRNMSEKQEKIMELVLVISLAVLPSLFSALFAYLGLVDMNYSSSNIHAIHILQIINQIIILAVFFYVLYRQGRGPEYIGLSFSWKDIFTGLALAVIAYIAAFFAGFMIIFYSALLGFELNVEPQNIEMFSTGPLSILLLILFIVNSFYEELIVRAYFINEMESFTNNTALAVSLCVIIQTSYHIYQGIISLFVIATLFTVFSLYYIKKRRIMPVIFAHTYYNILSAVLSRILKDYLG
jgi:membrane protease YdiL (CAAX protease family)